MGIKQPPARRPQQPVGKRAFAAPEHSKDTDAFRYTLTRDIETVANDRLCCFIMLNPSTADEVTDDATIKRCIAFAESYNCGKMLVLNLFALRATNPDELWAAETLFNARGLLWYSHFKRVVKVIPGNSLVIAGWGARPSAKQAQSWYDEQVKLAQSLCVSANLPLKALQLNKDGSPRHPLYVSGDAQLLDFPSNGNDKA